MSLEVKSVVYVAKLHFTRICWKLWNSRYNALRRYRTNVSTLLVNCTRVTNADAGTCICFAFTLLTFAFGHSVISVFVAFYKMGWFKYRVVHSTKIWTIYCGLKIRKCCFLTITFNCIFHVVIFGYVMKKKKKKYSVCRSSNMRNVRWWASTILPRIFE